MLAYDILYPTVSSISEPDYINQSLLNWIEYRESVATAQKRTYAYAKNYEEFIKMIDESDDVEQLKQIRWVGRYSDGLVSDGWVPVERGSDVWVWTFNFGVGVSDRVCCVGICR